MFLTYPKMISLISNKNVSVLKKFQLIVMCPVQQLKMWR